MPQAVATFEDMINTPNNIDILLIDDDAIMRMLVTRFLTLSGFTGNIYTAEDGQEGLDFVYNHKTPLTIILDYHMPLMNGNEVLANLDSHGITHPVFILSSSETEDLEREYQKYEWVQGFFDKPIDLEKAKEIFAFTTEYALTLNE